MKKLITLTAYVLEQNKTSLPLLTTNWYKEFETRFKNIVNYAKFLSMPLELKMFVPCDDEGNIFEEPKTPHTFASENADEYIKKWNKEKYYYSKGLSEVIFEGFEYGKKGFAKKNFDYVDEEFCETRTIEDIVKEFDNLTLTTEAIQKYKF